MESKVKWFNNEKGYGFIEYKENEDIFVHYSQILQDGYKSLNQGENVYFELIETDKGFQAKNVQAARNIMKLIKSIIIDLLVFNHNIVYVWHKSNISKS